MTANQIFLSRLEFVTNEVQIATLITSAFIACEPCFGVRFIDVDGQIAEDWTRVGVEANYAPNQILLAALMACLSYLRASAAQNNEDARKGEKRFLKNIKAGSTDTEFEQINVEKEIDVDKLIKSFEDESNSISASMGCFIKGGMVQAMFSNSIISSPFYIHKDC
jgi:uncharacterized OsmC-like protein